MKYLVYLYGCYIDNKEKFREKNWEIDNKNILKLTSNPSFSEKNFFEKLQPGDEVLLDISNPKRMQEIAIQCLERGAHAFMIWMQKDYQGKLVKINQIYEMPFNQWYHRVFRQRQNEAPTAAPSPQLKPTDPSPADPAASEDAVQAPLKPLAEITSEILRYASCKSSSDVQ